MNAGHAVGVALGLVIIGVMLYAIFGKRDEADKADSRDHE